MPPATPAPSRFLTSKRSSTQQSQSQTPNPQYARGSSQFHATPRFAASTPRPSSTQAGAAFATPALVIKPRGPRTRSTQDIIDDSSPISPEDGPPFELPVPRDTLPEPIEFDSSLAPESPSTREFNEGRSPKRRRISIASSEPGSDSVVNSPQSGETDLGFLPDRPDGHIVSYHSDVDDGDEDDGSNDGGANISPTQSLASPARHPSHSGIEVEEGSDPETPDEDAENELFGLENPEPTTAAQSKAAFRHAPRFKPVGPAEKLSSHTDAYLTADIFSPQRRGAKYLAGGLAAELRDWLVDAKGGVDGEGEVKATSSALRFPSAASPSVRVVVDEVSGGGLSMTLISGRLVDGGSDGRDVKVILAGEGNIEGLGAGKGDGHRSRVVPGAVVTVAPPAWDVQLDEQWAVAYRWEVVQGD